VIDEREPLTVNKKSIRGDGTKFISLTLLWFGFIRLALLYEGFSKLNPIMKGFHTLNYNVKQNSYLASRIRTVLHFMAMYSIACPYWPAG